MGVRTGVAVALLVLALVLMVMALVALVPATVALRERRGVLRAMPRAQRQRLEVVVRRGGEVGADEVAGARVVAAVAAGQGYSVLGGAAGTALAVGLVVFPWSSGVMAGWVGGFFAVGLLLQGVSAVGVLRRVRRGRRFLAAHPAPGSVSVGVAR